MLTAMVTLWLLAAGELPVVEVDVNVLRSWFQFVAEVAVVVGILATIRRRADKRIEALITQQTQPIQPGYRNGSASLEDLAHKLGTIQSTVRTLEISHADQRVLVLDVRERVADLADKVETNRAVAEQGLATLTSVVEANAEAAAKLGLALQGRSATPSPEDTPDLD